MSLLDFIFPKRCVGCDKLGKYFCIKCIAKIERTKYQICPICGGRAMMGVTHPGCRTKYTIDGLNSVFRYDGTIRKAIKLLKYQLVSDLAREFINLIPQSLPFQLTTHNTSTSLSASPQPTTLIPIPLHLSRLRFRGFNQTEVLGRLIADKLNIPVKTDILTRVKKTIPQVEMKDRKKRLANMEGVFVVNNFQPKADGSLAQTILLFDDVFTTGATLRAAANILKRAGVKKVWGLVMAHG